MTIKTLKDLREVFDRNKNEPVAIARNTTVWHYIVRYVIDLRNAEDYQIIDSNYISLETDMNSECYHGECVENETIQDIVGSEYTGHVKFDGEPGVYVYVLGAKCQGSKTWTDCGYEYDAWQEYDVLSVYRYTDEEAEFLDKENKEQ